MMMRHIIYRGSYIFQVSYEGSLDYDPYTGKRPGNWVVESTSLKGQGFFDNGKIVGETMEALERAIDSRIEEVLYLK